MAASDDDVGFKYNKYTYDVNEEILASSRHRLKKRLQNYFQVSPDERIDDSTNSSSEQEVSSAEDLTIHDDNAVENVLSEGSEDEAISPCEHQPPVSSEDSDSEANPTAVTSDCESISTGFHSESDYEFENENHREEISDNEFEDQDLQDFNDLLTEERITITISKMEIYVIVQQLALCHQYSDVEIADLLNALSAVLNNYGKISLFKFKKIFASDLYKHKKFHFYCTNCGTVVRSMTSTEHQKLKNKEKRVVICDGCSRNVKGFSLKKENHFITLSIRPQIENIINNIGPNLFSYKEEIESRGIDRILDKISCEGYRTVVGERSHNLSLTVNTDGAKLTKSSKKKMWPIFATVNELDPASRFHFSNVILLGVRYDKKDPRMEIFLYDFVKELIQLSTEGITWSYQDKSFNIKIFLTCFCCDSPAKAKVQKITQYNGYYGCPYCLYPGTKINTQIRYPYIDGIALRKHEEVKEQMIRWMEIKERIEGVRGVSPLIAIQHFNLTKGFCVDFMHCILLGVTETMATFWFDFKYNESDFYIGGEISVINEQLLSITPPKEVPRFPRAVTDRGDWKATEWYCWLLFYSLPCLQDILRSRFLKHFALLVEAIYVLLGSIITKDEPKNCEDSLLEFVKTYEKFYGSYNVFFNFHLLLHLVDAVKFCGPLWASFCFVFESAIGLLDKNFTGALSATNQMIPNYCINLKLIKLLRFVNFRPTRLQFFESLSTYTLFQNAAYVNDCVVIGDSEERELNEIEKIDFTESGKTPPDRIESYNRFINKAVMYYTTNYKKSEKSDNSVIKALARNSYGIIMSAFIFDQKLQVLIEEFDVVRKLLNMKHLKIGWLTGKIRLLPGTHIYYKFILMNVNNIYYITDFPNRLRTIC